MATSRYHTAHSERKISVDAKPNAKAPLGQGGRFAALKETLSHEKGVTNPGALAASIGRRKYGARRFQALAKAGRRGK
jgi:hypothetical protein